MPTISVPDYDGGSIINLVAEIESRLGGDPPSPGLRAGLAGHLPDADGYVVVVFDGLGSAQTEHSETGVFAAARAADLDAPFPATTTVSLASLATGLVPRRHGLLGYQLWIEETGHVVNTIKWTTLWGTPIEYRTEFLLPAPNLWERLGTVGIESITVQPANFDRSPLTRALYRGSRFAPASDPAELATRTIAAAGPGRLVFTYVPYVDFAAHVYGQSHPEYGRAVAIASSVWKSIEQGIPAGVGLVGTADHGHVDFPADRQHRIPKHLHEDRTFYGDGRAMFVRGDGKEIADAFPATWIPIESAGAWWGSGEAHPRFEARAPDGVLLADDDALILHRHSDDRMIGNHGAMTAAEQRVPLLTRLGPGRRK